jgi:ferrous iron transport protein B
MRLALVGQPNSGKSTIFNWIAGYKSATANFPGTTVSYTISKVRLNGAVAELTDLPGIYSLSASDRAADAALEYLRHHQIDAIVNVIDASRLRRGLELTLQLLELGHPVVVCLNMMDEAKRRGVHIELERLSSLLGVPVIAAVASKGEGVSQVFQKVREHLRVQNSAASVPSYPGVEKIFERPANFIVSSERHASATRLFEQTVTLGKPDLDWRDQIDGILMHKYWGYFFLALILLASFNLIFSIGAALETHLLAWFEAGRAQLQTRFGETSLWISMLSGVVQGLSAGVAIVFPYLVPFLLIMAVLEDGGYLPRVAFLMDALMHRLGLHGTSVLPAILGYGCSVPAVMATRILRSPRDRLIAAALAIMVPCSARTAVILGLVAFYLGPNAALAIYGVNILVVALAGKILSKIWPEITPGLIMEIPPYRLPTIRALLAKTWWRLKEFIFVAWPVLIAGSAALSLAEHWQLDQSINRLLQPVTAMLALPEKVGTTLIFGVMRKELSMLMLMQAVGTTNVAAVLTPAQMLTFTMFVVFYIPCLATIAVLWREIGKAQTILLVALTLLLAMGVGVLTVALAKIIF